MLAMPHRDDQRRLTGYRLIDVVWFEDEPVGPAHETDIRRQQKSQRLLRKLRSAEALVHFGVRRFFARGPKAQESGGDGQ
jgi:hypothetical protein